MAAELTRVAFLLNLDVERELADPRHYRRDPAIEARIRALRPRLAFMDAEDRALGDDDCGACTRAIAYCPTPHALARIRDAGFAVPDAPPLGVLRTVNARAFCASLGQTLPHARYVTSLEGLRETVAAGAWLLKRDFGFAGRERLRIDALDVASEGFARRSFARGEGLQVEPYLQVQREVCQHGYLTARGALRLAAPRLQECDARGSWVASSELPDGALDTLEREMLAESTSLVARALSRAGYFGPFALDAYRYRDGEQAAFQPRSELNARLSMGYPRSLLAQLPED